MADIGGQQDTRNVCAVGGEFTDGDDGGSVMTLDHAPDVNVALFFVLILLVPVWQWKYVVPRCCRRRPCCRLKPPSLMRH
jgi:hypothetical protein